MRRLFPLILLLAACESTIYSDADDVRDTCSALGLEGAAHAECVARRTREAKCRKIVDHYDRYDPAARAQGCE